MDVLLAAPDRTIQTAAAITAILLFPYNTGARASEAAAATIGDLDLRPDGSGSVRLVGKRDKTQHRPLWATTVICLRALIHGRGPQEVISLSTIQREAALPHHDTSCRESPSDIPRHQAMLVHSRKAESVRNDSDGARSLVVRRDARGPRGRIPVGEFALDPTFIRTRDGISHGRQSRAVSIGRAEDRLCRRLNAMEQRKQPYGEPG
jgi:integrase